MGISIRNAALSDSGALIALDSYVKVDAARAHHIRRWVAAGECWVAELDGAVAGYGVLNYSFFHQGQVEVLVVADVHQRKGVGRALVRHLTA